MAADVKSRQQIFQREVQGEDFTEENKGDEELNQAAAVSDLIIVMRLMKLIVGFI
jgi:hypothetical protein